MLHVFHALDEGNKTSTWIRFVDNLWYAVGRAVKIECVVFQAPDPIGDLPPLREFRLENLLKLLAFVQFFLTVPNC